MRYSDPRLLMAKPKWLIQTRADLARHEGFREFAYPDPLSKLAKIKAKWGFEPADIILARLGLSERDGRPWTIGYGFTRNVKPSHHMSKQAADQLLEREILEHLHVLDRLTPEWKQMPLFAQTVLVNLAYNMGYERLSKFAPTLALFQQGDFKGAARRLRATAWFKQVGKRAVELVERLETGAIQQRFAVV